jgi:hypothetical protein
MFRSLGNAWSGLAWLARGKFNDGSRLNHQGSFDNKKTPASKIKDAGVPCLRRQLGRNLVDDSVAIRAAV